MDFNDIRLQISPHIPEIKAAVELIQVMETSNEWIDRLSIAVSKLECVVYSGDVTRNTCHQILGTLNSILLTSQIVCEGKSNQWVKSRQKIELAVDAIAAVVKSFQKVIRGEMAVTV